MAAYMGTAASVPFLRRKLSDGPHTILLPGGPAIPIATLAVCTLLLSQAKDSNLIAGAIALAVGALIYVAGEAYGRHVTR
jgi:hypothetical protein